MKGNLKGLELRYAQAQTELKDSQARTSQLEKEKTELSDSLHKTVEENSKQARQSQTSILQTLSQKESEYFNL